MTLEANDLAFYFVMCPTNDGDVSGKGGAAAGTGTGFRHYARARCPKALVQVTRCCHNRFNSVWGDPAQKFGGDESTLLSQQLAPDVHDVPMLVRVESTDRIRAGRVRPTGPRAALTRR